MPTKKSGVLSLCHVERSRCTSATEHAGIVEVLQLLRTAVEQIVASCHRSLRKSGRRYRRLACPSCCNDRRFGPDSAEHCLEVYRCSSWIRMALPVVWQRQVFWSRQCRTLSGGIQCRVATTGVLVQTVQNTVWRYTGPVHGQGCRARVVPQIMGKS